jgi:hypothetical protein
MLNESSRADGNFGPNRPRPAAIVESLFALQLREVARSFFGQPKSHNYRFETKLVEMAFRYFRVAESCFLFLSWIAEIS